MPPREDQPDAGRITRICVLAWMAGAFLFALVIPSMRTWRGVPGEYFDVWVPGRPIGFGSAEHIAISAVLILVAGPAAGVLTARLIRKWPSSGAPE